MEPKLAARDSAVDCTAAKMADEGSNIVELLEQRAKLINTLDDKWIAEWALLIEKHFKQETRNHVRLKAIALLSQIFSKYHVIWEDELMSKIIIPNFGEVDQEMDSVVRKPIVHLLFDVASACLSYKHCNVILAIVRRILNKPYKQKSEEHGGLVYIIGNVDIIDSRLTISNLNKLLRLKLHRLPIDPAANTLDILVNYLSLTYRCPLQEPTPAEIPMIRRELFSLFLNLRCNKFGHLGILGPGQAAGVDQVSYSPFIICVRRAGPLGAPPSLAGPHKAPASPLPPDSPTGPGWPWAGSSASQSIFEPNAAHPNCPLVSRCVNLEALFGAIVECIRHETDADVLRLVLSGLAGLLSNKPLVLSSATDERLNQLCVALSELVRPAPSNQLLQSLAHQPRPGASSAGSTPGARHGQLAKIDAIGASLHCLATMLIYRKSLEPRSVKHMLAAFGESLVASRLSVVPVFTTCLIELHDSPEMAKFLPGVLDRLSKFSPTTHLGASMLEFLSYLILFPKLYADFSEDDYKCIFAIALPYTNPIRFGDYITCLAFRVIAMWYLNCRPSLRCAFVDLVKKSLQSNVIQPFRENSTATIYSAPGQPAAAPHQPGAGPITHTPPVTHSCPATMSPVDQRKRSSSLNAENSLKAAQQAAFGFPALQSSLQVNEELLETFADLLSRYTHGQYLAIAPKNRCIEQFLDRSSSQTWLQGNSLITITSGRANHGWAEIMIRRPTGNTSWIGRLQNTTGALPMLNQQVYLDSLNFGNDILSLFSTLVSYQDAVAAAAESAAGSGDSTAPSSAGSQSTPARSGASSLANAPSELSLAEGSPGPSGASSASSSGVPSSAGAPGAAPAAARLRDPILLPKDKKSDVALSNFDHITPYETHKVGVVYVARKQQDNRAAILSNKFGSSKYYEFLANMGTCIILNDIDPEIYFIGGLDAKGDDGKYAYFWKDNVTQVIFHVATFMPLRESEPQCNNKNRHIGNDHVCIVYNDSRAKFHMSTMKGTGQILSACIVVTPLDDETNVVELEVLPELTGIVGELEPKTLSNVGASLYARQLAIHLNLASKIHERRKCEGFFHKEPYVSNWVERLRCIKRIRQRLEESRRSAAHAGRPVK